MSDAYEPGDPKSEGYYDRMADVWDNRDKSQRLEVSDNVSGKWNQGSDRPRRYVSDRIAAFLEEHGPTDLLEIKTRVTGGHSVIRRTLLYDLRFIRSDDGLWHLTGNPSSLPDDPKRKGGNVGSRGRTPGTTNDGVHARAARVRPLVVEALQQTDHVDFWSQGREFALATGRAWYISPSNVRQFASGESDASYDRMLVFEVIAHRILGNVVDDALAASQDAPGASEPNEQTALDVPVEEVVPDVVDAANMSARRKQPLVQSVEELPADEQNGTRPDLTREEIQALVIATMPVVHDDPVLRSAMQKLVMGL